MGKKDTAAKIYMSHNEKFADAFNYTAQVSDKSNEHKKIKI